LEHSSSFYCFCRVTSAPSFSVSTDDVEWSLLGEIVVG
jgi:hypothetical protein